MLNLQHLKYVLFDWDNTLADTRPLLVAAVNRVLSEYNLPEWETSKQKRNPDLSFRDNFPNIFGEKAVQAYQRYTEVYLQEISKLKPVSGAPEALEYFRKQNLPLLIMSNKDRKLLDIEVKQLYNPKWFLRIVGGHEAARDKPWPEHAWYALQGLLAKDEITPDKVWIIGDTAQDSRCALAAGACPIRIGKPIWQTSEEHLPGVCHFDSFEQFYQALPQD